MVKACRKKQKVPMPPTPTPYSTSTPAQSGLWQVVEDGEVVPGDTVAYFLDMASGPDWFQGVVKKIYRSVWADILYPDGQMCCKWLDSERGVRWVKVVAALTSPAW